ncbi:MAG: MarR family transcriptional regulator [Flavobacteriales bacterium]|nr:MarR family transcriptional regulator [Flavobacteriales bacterium]NNK80922.1 MarR family transcriptional regulator [Flavobacteriales bacterium]
MDTLPVFPSIQSLIPTIGRTMKCIDMFIKKEFNEVGLVLTKNQFIVLRLVHESPRPQSSLALITERNKGSLARLIHSLESKDYVKRQVLKEDRRVKVIMITPRGEETLRRAIPVILSVFEKLQLGLDTEDSQTTMRVLEKVMSNAQKELQLNFPIK